MNVDRESAVNVNSMEWCFIALGSNQGDSPSIIREAMDALEAGAPAPLRRSSLWRSAPVDCPPGSPPFVNAVVGLQPLPGTTPESLLDRLQHLERRFGRLPKRVPNEPRPLDLDLLAWGGLVRETPDLVLPHPRAHERRFVLAPWKEIAPDFVVPGQGRTVRDLLERLKPEGELERW